MRSCGPKEPFVIDSGFHIGVSWQICRHRFSRKKAVQRMQSIVVWSVYYSRKSSTTIKRLLHAGPPCNRTRIYAARVPRAADDARRPPNYAVLLPAARFAAAACAALGHAWTDRRTRFNTLADTRSASYSVNMAKRARSKIGNRAVGT